MTTGRIEIVLAYTGDRATVEGALNEMLANARQRALTAEYARRGSAAGVIPWAKAILIEDDGEIIRHGAFHVDADAPDADQWNVVDDRLPNEEPVGGWPEPVDPSAIRIWAPGETYVLDEQTSHEGIIYKQLQPTHTTQVGWEPGAAGLASVWQVV
ncbi:MAG: carbohydrate-binding protein [Dermatophilaceae bacterium]|nr:hypothetical protein [Intrasporangiaceae bacterium]